MEEDVEEEIINQMVEEEATTTSSASNKSSVVLGCDSKEMHYFIHSSFLTAVIIIIAMSFMNRRRHLRKDCCGARPGLAVPINLLDDFDNRWSYACSFGALTNTIVVIFIGPQYFGFPAPDVAKMFVGLVTAIEVCIIYFPLFACINTHHVTSGSIIGLFYSSTWLFASIKQLVHCTVDPIPEVLPYAGLVLSLPNIVCLTCIAGRFFYNLIRSCLDKTPVRQEFKQNVAEVWHINYVKERINCRESLQERKRCGKLLEFIRKYIYERQPQFKYSTRIICSLFVVICCTYQLGLLYMVSNAYFSQWATEQVNHFVNYSGLPSNDTLVQNLYTTVTMLHVSWIVATGVSLTLFAINIIFILFRYRKDTLRLFQGRKEFIPPSVQKQDNALFVRNCMLFAGFQIAYMIWGYFVLNFVLWLLALLFCLLIVLPLMNGITDIVRFFANYCIIPLLVSVTLRAVQTVMSQKFFLQEKVDKEDKQKPLALNNIRAFHMTNYFFFMANIETGLFSCLYRILQGLIFGLIFLGRLDRCVLMGGLETQDLGYNAYLGMLYMEHTHNNPVLRVFCHLLLEGVKEKKAQPQTVPSRTTRCKGCDDGQLDLKDDEGSTKREELREADADTVKEFVRMREVEEGVNVGQTKHCVKMEEGVIYVNPDRSKSTSIADLDSDVHDEDEENSKKHLEQTAYYEDDKAILCDDVVDDGDDDEIDEPVGPKDKQRLSRHRWKILLTLFNNPQVVSCRKIKTEKKEEKKKKKKKKKSDAKTDLDTAMNTFVRYDQYRKLKEEIRELEVQIFGSFVERRLISIACQPSEDFEFASEVTEFDASRKESIVTVDDSIHKNASNKRGSNMNNAVQEMEKTAGSLIVFNDCKKASSWSGTKSEHPFFREKSCADGKLRCKDLRTTSSGPDLTTDFKISFPPSDGDIGAVTPQTNF